jgi:hypothetical protein
LGTDLSGSSKDDQPSTSVSATGRRTMNVHFTMPAEGWIGVVAAFATIVGVVISLVAKPELFKRPVVKVLLVPFTGVLAVIALIAVLTTIRISSNVPSSPPGNGALSPTGFHSPSTQGQQPTSVIPPTTQGQATHTPVAQAQAHAQAIRITRIAGYVKRCQYVEGTGDVPQGSYFRIMVKTNEGGRVKYYFDDAFVDYPGHWQAPNVYIGSDNVTADPVGEWFDVKAVFVTSAVDQDIMAGRYRDGTYVIPAGTTDQDHMAVQLGSDRAACPA